MLLGDIIAAFQDEAVINETLFSLGDLALTARLVALAAESNVSTGELAIESVGRFVNGASDEEWLTLIGQMSRSENPSGFFFDASCRSDAISSERLRSSPICGLRGRSMSSSPASSSMPPALERRLKYSGPALFSYGFRPFFLGGAAWSVACIVLWIPQLMGDLSLRTAYSPLDWHIHEMLYGYVAAVIAGFLLTAIPNWTGRLPINGGPLMTLAALWLAGRFAILFSAQLGILVAALIDVAFLATLAVVAAREIIAGRNWRNLRVLVLIGVLIAGNIAFHTEVYVFDSADYSIRIGIAAVIMLIALVGGRIVPSFTRNWLARRENGRLPAPFSRFDVASIAVSLVSLALWVALPSSSITGLALIAAAVMQIARLVRWAGDRTTSDRLVLVLHVGYAFVPIGFALLGASILYPLVVPSSVGIHAWTAGAVGLMTLAVMTRASLGHTGQPLTAGRGTQAIYLFVLCAAVFRIIAGFVGSMPLMEFAAAAWVAAFGGFVLFYGPILCQQPPVWAARE